MMEMFVEQPLVLPGSATQSIGFGYGFYKICFSCKCSRRDIYSQKSFQIYNNGKSYQVVIHVEKTFQVVSFQMFKYILRKDKNIYNKTKRNAEEKKKNIYFFSSELQIFIFPTNFGKSEFKIGCFFLLLSSPKSSEEQRQYPTLLRRGSNPNQDEANIFKPKY